MKKLFSSVVLALFVCHSVSSQIAAKLIQYPDVSETHICFTFGNDLWLVEKDGGKAIKLSSPDGRETNPKFSPDGNTIAYEANYDGNFDIYTIPVEGGVPQRVTGHGMTELIMDWSGDGNDILYTSSMESGKQRWSQFYLIDKDGGLPDKLPVELAARGHLSADGTKLAFTDKSRAFRTWKRYRGGTAPDIFIMDLNTLETRNITNNDANDESPMWHGNKIYYMSDKGDALRNNIWVFDTETDEDKQLTFFKDFDIHYPSIGPSDLVFEAGGQIYLMDLTTHNYEPVQINAVGDFTGIKPVTKKVSGNIMNYDISPDGNRALIEARGDVFTLPKKEGFVRNVTQTSGIAERFPAWSPDGKSLAYFSDKSGEYELYIKDLKSGTARKMSNLGPGFRYRIFWSPNSEMVAFIDQTMTFYTINVTSGEVNRIDQGSTLFEGGLRNFSLSWSPDSRWIAYTKAESNAYRAIYIYDTEEKKSHQVTSGFYSDNQAVFGAEGKYLFFSTNRRLSPIYSDFDNTWVYPNATQLALITLRKDVVSPLLPKNDTVAVEEPKKEEDVKDEDDKKKNKNSDDDEAEEDKEKDDKVAIDFDGISRRIEILPVSVGNMFNISAAKGKVIYMKVPNSGSESNDNTLKYFDLENQEEKSIISGINNYRMASKGSHVLVRKGNDYSIIEVGENKEMENMLAIGEMESTINPREEWKQIFNDVWRLERDFFYDENMHGVDWDKYKVQYGALIEQAMTRYDVNFIIGELIGELNASHTYRGGGDNESVEVKNVGYLGVDWGKTNDHFWIKKIIRGAEWDTEVRSPLDQPGIDVNPGDYVLSVNGRPLNNFNDPWIAFTGLAGKTVELVVNSKPSFVGSRSVLVTPLGDETRLRNLEWIESNRKTVDKASDGKIGYIYVPSTGIDGQNELIRMFYGQWHKDGLIIDERFNNGGQIPDRFVELLNRKPLAYFDVRDGRNWQWPPVAHFGPKAMLINGWSGSGGDAFPDYFRKSGLGPLIGSRTWGGLIGISGAPGLIDGGGVTVPTFRMYNPDGTWFREGYGVDPDMEVREDHEALAKGKDPQIMKAVEYILEELEKIGDIHPPTPEAEDRSK